MNNREAFESAVTSKLKNAGCSQLFIQNVLRKYENGNYLMQGTEQGLEDFCLGWQAALAHECSEKSQAQQEPLKQEEKYLVGLTVQDGHDTTINWHGRHPYSFPVGTKFFAIPPAPDGE